MMRSRGESAIAIFRGASLLALKKLGQAKGYSLVHAHEVNAFFVLSDLLHPSNRELSIRRLFPAKWRLHKQDSMNRPWVEV